jgi:hypothetical protein
MNTRSIEFMGLPLVLEKIAGEERYGTVLSAHYGYIVGTRGVDGEEMDVFLNPNPAINSDTEIFVVTQQDTIVGDYAVDEFKYMLGYRSAEDAKQAYLSNVPASMPEGAYGGVRAMSAEEGTVIRDLVSKTKEQK